MIIVHNCSLLYDWLWRDRWMVARYIYIIDNFAATHRSVLPLSGDDPSIEIQFSHARKYWPWAMCSSQITLTHALSLSLSHADNARLRIVLAYGSHTKGWMDLCGTQAWSLLGLSWWLELIRALFCLLAHALLVHRYIDGAMAFISTPEI